MSKLTLKKIKEGLIIGVMLLTPLTVLHLLSVGYIVTQASPELPYGSWGSVIIDGSPAVDGTEVTASINGTLIASTKTMTGGMYVLTIPADDPATKLKEGGIKGNIVSYSINGTKTASSSSWKSEISDRVNITE